jgi:DNA-binding transcriptional ArsR family regulator
MNAMQVLAEPRRQRILRAVWDRELSAGEIHRKAGRVTFGAVSQHVAVLAEHGFVTCRRAGRSRFYRANPAALGSLREYFEQLWGAKLSQLKQLAEQAAKEDGQ